MAITRLYIAGIYRALFHMTGGVLLVATCLITGCASQDHRADCNCSSDTATDNANTTIAGPKTTAGLSEQRRILSEGYSLLYSDASSLNLTKLIIYGKQESAPVEQIVAAVAKYAGTLEDELERIDKDYPGVRIDLEPLPVMEQRKRFAIAKDRAIEFAPAVGEGGRAFERMLLIGLLNGINHERHLCAVMAEEEPDPNLKQFLLDTKKHYDGFYQRIDTLLNEAYYK